MNECKCGHFNCFSCAARGIGFHKHKQMKDPLAKVAELSLHELRAIIAPIADSCAPEIETVGELIEHLQTWDPKTKVGVCQSQITGWVQGIQRICSDEQGRCLIDQTETTLDPEEATIKDGQ